MKNTIKKDFEDFCLFSTLEKVVNKKKTTVMV